MSEPVWIRADVARAVHRRQIAEHGGLDGLRDPGLLTSALERPKSLLAFGDPAPDPAALAALAALAAAYAWGIARNHPFADGNKRTALVLLRLFLRLNGADVSASGIEKYDLMMRLAAGEVSEAALADWVRSNMPGRASVRDDPRGAAVLWPLRHGVGRPVDLDFEADDAERQVLEERELCPRPRRTEIRDHGCPLPNGPRNSLTGSCPPVTQRSRPLPLPGPVCATTKAVRCCRASPPV